MSLKPERPQLTRCRCCDGAVSNQARWCPHCGQPDPGPVADWEREAKEILRQGKKINAIKLVRESTGMDLATAKDLVESWES